MAQRKSPVHLLAERLELSRSSVFRLCYTLDQLGFVRRTRLGYEMGPRVLTLGAKRQGDHDPGRNEAGAEPEPAAAGGRPVVLPARAVHPAAAPAES